MTKPLSKSANLNAKPPHGGLNEWFSIVWGGRKLVLYIRGVK
jgi:hypothetical protein